MTAQQLHIDVDLGRPLRELETAIQRTIYLTALGLNAVSRFSQKDLELPGTSIQVSLARGSAWPIEEAQQAFTHRTLVNGFRDAAEAVGGFLDSTHTALAVSNPGIGAQSTPLTNGDWQEALKREERRFHRFGLPNKLEHLQQTYRLHLDELHIKHICSINAARNCLVHRGGIVRERDTDDNGALQVSWRRLALFVADEDGERALCPPMVVKGPGGIYLGHRDTSKLFPIGTAVSFSVQEFADLCWSLFLFGGSTTKLVQQWAKDRGIHLQGPQGDAT